MTEISKDRFANAVKSKKLATLPWAADQLTVRMPDRNANLIISRVEDGYTVQLADGTDSPVRDTVQQRLNKITEEYGEVLGELTLKAVFPGLVQLYAARHKPKPLRLPPVQEFEGEVADKTLPSMYYLAFIEKLEWRGLVKDKRVKWGPHAHYGDECTIVAMPNASTNLLVVRTHSKDGAAYALFTAPDQPMSDPALVRATQKRIADYCHGKLDADGVRSAIGAVASMQCNRQKTEILASLDGQRDRF